jgi:hypothetical protein
VAHLVEFDARRLYLGAGCRSLFVYCTAVLGLSGHEAYNRIEAARVASKFRGIIEGLGDGRWTVTTLRLLAPHLDDGNHQALLLEAVGKSKREVELLIACHFPKAAVPDSVRKVAAPKIVSSGETSAGSDTSTKSDPGREAVIADAAVSGGSPEPVEDVVGDVVATTLTQRPQPGALEFQHTQVQHGLHSEGAVAAAPPPKRAEEMRPLSADQFAIRFTASARSAAAHRGVSSSRGSP